MKNLNLSGSLCCSLLLCQADGFVYLTDAARDADTDADTDTQADTDTRYI